MQSRLAPTLLAFVCLVTPSLRGGEIDRPIGMARQSGPNTFSLFVDGTSAVIAVDPQETLVVKEVAAEAFSADIKRVTGSAAPIERTPTWDDKLPAVIIGTVGTSGLLTDLIDAGRLHVDDLVGQWESFKIVHLPARSANESAILVIAGSDRRGTAYGVFEVSAAIGVSPWYWWADVPVTQCSEIYLTTNEKRSGPPTVKYRGIFINDEDWGLQPWAARTFEPETGDIGPKTYAAIFELLLRLKANYVWPAMHPSTRAFNHYPANKEVADRYALVMGSSHAEPMLRNNVDEWKHDERGDWDFVNNADEVMRYWEQRVAENARYENIFTVGMRGIHDSAMIGGGSVKDQARRLKKIFAIQRDMLERHVGKQASEIPQAFVPYKEVLGIYRTGLQVPPDVTLGWIDDNYGYIRQLSNDAERQRPGGSGVYYHLSYWGQPHDFLWLDSTPPGLVWEEMTKALEFGADRLWVVNVGDLKPIEIGLDWFLRLGWDANAYGPADAQQGMVDFFQRNFGAEHAAAMADVMSEYYRLNHSRKPEFMGWSTVYPTTSIQHSEISHWAHGDEAQRRLDEFKQIQSDAEEIGRQLPDSFHDAYFQLVLYPVRSAANMNRKFIHAEKSRLYAALDLPAANDEAELAERAFQQIQQDTHYYNDEVAGGKWRGMMSASPRNLAAFQMPSTGKVPALGPPRLKVRVAGKSVMAIAANTEEKIEPETAPTIRAEMSRIKIAGQLTRNESRRGTVVTLPDTAAQPTQPIDGPARMTWDFDVALSGNYELRLEVNHPSVESDSWYIVLDECKPITWNDNPTNGGWRWFDIATFPLSKGHHRLTLVAREDGARLRGMEFVPAGPTGIGKDLVLTQNPNCLPSINSDTRREIFVDLFNGGRGSLSWIATANQPWVKFSSDAGEFPTHQRILIHADFEMIAKRGATSATIAISETSGSPTEYQLELSAFQHSRKLPAGTFAEDNGVISIDAEHFASSKPGADGRQWRVIKGVGYSGSCVGMFPRLLADGDKIQGSHSSPTLIYPIHINQSGTATIAFQALPTHEINAARELICGCAISKNKLQTVHFPQGNDELNPTWKRNILRNAMTGSVDVKLDAGQQELTVYGLDPSVVLDRITITMAPVASSYLGPRETRIQAFSNPDLTAE